MAVIGKKGAVFTLLSVLLGGLVFSIAMLSARYNNAVEDNISPSLSVNRASFHAAQISYSLNKILTENGLSAEATDNSVIISQKLPLDTVKIESDVNSFRDFGEMLNYSEIVILPAKTLALDVFPYNANYTTDGSITAGINDSANSSFEFKVNDAADTQIIENIISGLYKLDIIVTDGANDYKRTFSIDISKQNAFDIISGDNHESIMVNDGKITIKHISGDAADIKSIFGFSGHSVKGFSQNMLSIPTIEKSGEVEI